MTFDPRDPGHPLGAFRSAPASRLAVQVRRFSKGTRISFVILAVLVLGGAVAIVNIVPAKGGKHDPIGLVIVVAGFIATGLIGATFFEREASLHVTGDELVLDDGLLGRFPRAGARLASWTMPDGSRRGSALILAGPAPFTLGGLGHTPTGTASESVTRVDAYLSSEDFDALLAAAPVAATAPSASLRCSLAAGPAGWKAMAPWLATIAIAAALGTVRGALSDALGQPGIGFAIAMGTVILGGLATTVVLSVRRGSGPQGWLDFDAHRFVVSDRAGRVLLEAPPHLVVTRPMRCTYRGRTTFVMPVIALSAPGFADVTVGVNEFTAGWPERVPSCGSPRFVVGGADWTALVQRLRQRPPVPARA